MYLSLHLQNHKGFRFGSSWGVVEKISKLPSWRGLQKNHAQLQFKQGFPCKLKMSWVWMWSNFKITLVRGPHEYPIEQSKQTVKAKSSCQSQQRNANQSKASAHNMRKQSAYHQSEVKLSEQSERLSQPASPPASQPVSQPASQPASQPTNQPTNKPTNQPTN